MTKFPVTTHGVIRKGDRILVVRRADDDEYMPGLWDMPGGKLELGETPEGGLRREVKEETNVEVEVGDIDFVFTDLKEAPDIQYFMLIFECKYISGDVVLNPEEHVDHRWVTMDELKEMSAMHFVRGWLQRK